jgi:hypothetical protein
MVSKERAVSIFGITLLPTTQGVTSAKDNTVLNISLYIFGPPLWSRGQNDWLQIQKSEFESRSYQIFREVVGLEQGPFSHMSTIEELLEK